MARTLPRATPALGNIFESDQRAVARGREEPVSEFKSTALRELTEQQARFAPPARRQAQIANAQKLLGEIESGKTYPYSYVSFRITDYRSDAHHDALIAGDDLRHDLAQFIRRVTFTPIPSLWGHPAGAGGNPADRAFLNENVSRFLANR